MMDVNKYQKGESPFIEADKTRDFLLKVFKESWQEMLDGQDKLNRSNYGRK